MLPAAAMAVGGLNTDSNGDDDGGGGGDVDGAATAAVVVVVVWKGLKSDADGAAIEGIELDCVANGIGGIPKRPPDDVENAGCCEDGIGEAPGAAIFCNEE